jgi:hypothetical protein
MSDDVQYDDSREHAHAERRRLLSLPMLRKSDSDDILSCATSLFFAPS